MCWGEKQYMKNSAHKLPKNNKMLQKIYAVNFIIKWFCHAITMFFFMSRMREYSILQTFFIQPEQGFLFILSDSLRLICVRQFETSLLHYINCLSCPWRKRFISVTITICILRHSVEIVLIGSFPFRARIVFQIIRLCKV